jgi:hypothetical protein
MRFKSMVSILLIGGVLVYLGIRPSDLMDQGNNFWRKFSGDFLAIFDGKAPNRGAKEMEATAGGDAQANCVVEPGATDDESAALAREIVRDRCEQAKRAKVIVLNPEELRKQLENRERQSE